VVTTLLLVRHGESEWNASGRWQGHADSELSELGRLQARHAGQHLRAHWSIDALVASDLLRAAETARIIGHELGLPVSLEPGWRERSAGEWEGLTREEIEEEWPGYLTTGQRPPGFESDAELLDRVVPTATRIASHGGGRTVLVVSHAGVLRALERHHGVASERVPNLGGRLWRIVGQVFEAGARLVLVDPDEVTRPIET
jgi:probable phosphoglycerate mutase